MGRNTCEIVFLKAVIKKDERRRVRDPDAIKKKKKKGGTKFDSKGINFLGKKQGQW